MKLSMTPHHFSTLTFMEVKSMIMILILCTLIVIILILAVLNHVKFKRQNDYLRYANKRLILKLEHEKKKNNTKIIPSIQAIRTPHHDTRRIKNVLIETFEQLKKTQDITSYKILSTNQIAKRNTFFADLSLVDFIVLSNLGLYLVKLTHFNTQTFMHFNGTSSSSHPLQDQFAHHVSKIYHQQFHVDSNVPYTFSEEVTPDKVIYQFYKYDPLKRVETAEAHLSQDLEKRLKTHISTMACLIDTNEKIYESQSHHPRNVLVIKDDATLTQHIHSFAQTSHSNLSDDKLSQLESLLTQKH